jgi:protein TonB
MGRAAKLVEPRRANDEAAGPATLDVGAVTLPPPVPAFTRADGISLMLAGMLHVAIIAAFVAPDRRLGIGGIDLEAIGIEIVTVAPALDARSTARGRDQAGALAQVAEQDGGGEQAVEEVATRDSRRDEKPSDEAAAPPADIVVRDWVEPQRPADAPASEPVIAPVKGDGTNADTAERSPETAEQRSTTDSTSAAEVLARFRGGAAARGHEETVTLAPDAMAAARAGQRDAYKEALVRSILETVRASPPRNATGRSGVVRVEFRVRTDGTVGEVRVAQSSSSGALDEVALATMRAMRLPAPPPALAGNQLFYDMTFTFR